MIELRTLLLGANQSVNLIYCYTGPVMVFFVGQSETMHHHGYISRDMTFVGLELTPFPTETRVKVHKYPPQIAMV
jgi:hypothetical protein